MALKSLAVFRPKLSELCALCTFFLKNIVHRLEIDSLIIMRTGVHKQLARISGVQK